MSIKNYSCFYLFFVLLFAFGLAFFNELVDPYLIFNTKRVEGFNEKKPRSVNRTQLYKPYEMEKFQPVTVIVGNSRPEMGINPDSQCWLEQHGKVYSLTFPGLGAYGQIRALFHGLATRQVHHVLLGLDFIDFLYKRQAVKQPLIWPDRHSDFFDRLLVDANMQPNARQYRMKLYDNFMSLFTLDAVFDSIFTIMSQSPDSATRTVNGFNPAGEYRRIISYEGAWVLYGQKLNELKKKFSRSGMSIFDTPENWSLELEGLRRVIELTKQKGIQLTLFINPYHYSYLEIINQSGYWDEFEAFKQSLQKLVRQYSGQNVSLWDFSLYSQYTVSPVPSAEADILPKWFWEPAHYKSELGDIMLYEMFGKKCLTNFPGAALGVDLKNIDLEKHFKIQLQQREILLNKINEKF